METRQILERLYRLPDPRPSWVRVAMARFVRNFWDWIRDHTTRLVIGAVVIAVWIATHVYYYNWLYDLETNVQEARAQITVAQQKRDHVQRSLTRLVRYYAAYERSVMHRLTELRTQESPAERAPAEQLLAQLDAVAEAYPKLNLSETVAQLSQTVTANESEVADRISSYNVAVNVYSTALGQFPANVFGKPLGFGDYAFYEPEDSSVVQYREVEP